MPERYQKYFEQMPCYLSVHDRDFLITEGNQRFREDFGDRIGEPCYEIYKNRNEVCPDCPVEKTFADGLSHSSEQTLITRSGVETPVMVHTTPVHDENGDIAAVIEMHTDIRKVKDLEKQLQQSQRRLARLFEMVPCYISVQGPDLVIQHANRAFRETFGRAVGDHCYRVYKHRQEPCLVCPAMAVFADGKAREHEEVVTTADGRRLNVLCNTAPITNAEGEVVAVIELSTDITQIRQLQDQLTSIGLLVGSISHGIKGLLNGLAGGIYLVNSGFEKDDHGRVTKGWQMVQRNVDRIRSMVLDILYYAKDRDLDVTDIDVAELMEQFHELLTKRASDMDVALSFRAAPDAGAFLGDSKAIRAMLLNILENSLEACRSDTKKSDHWVKFTARRAAPWMIFEVEDNGIGMDRETREKIFSLFFSSKGIAGTGLGLFISNKIVDKHGGTIDVDSQPERGTRFLIRLPLEARPSTRPAEDGDSVRSLGIEAEES
jgi:PAS domain S-box-containing protein